MPMHRGRKLPSVAAEEEAEKKGITGEAKKAYIGAAIQHAKENAGHGAEKAEPEHNAEHRARQEAQAKIDHLRQEKQRLERVARSRRYGADTRHAAQQHLGVIRHQLKKRTDMRADPRVHGYDMPTTPDNLTPEALERAQRPAQPRMARGKAEPQHKPEPKKTWQEQGWSSRFAYEKHTREGAAREKEREAHKRAQSRQGMKEWQELKKAHDEHDELRAEYLREYQIPGVGHQNRAKELDTQHSWQLRELGERDKAYREKWGVDFDRSASPRERWGPPRMARGKAENGNIPMEGSYIQMLNDRVSRAHSLGLRPGITGKLSESPNSAPGDTGLVWPGQSEAVKVGRAWVKKHARDKGTFTTWHDSEGWHLTVHPDRDAARAEGLIG